MYHEEVLGLGPQLLGDVSNSLAAFFHNVLIFGSSLIRPTVNAVERIGTNPVNAFGI
jgi:hypothetical protein